MKIGIDLGGTNIRAALVNNGQVLSKESMPCPSKECQDIVLEAIFVLIDKLMNSEVDGIGIGVPSIVDSTKGIVYDVVNIPSWKCVPLKDILEKKYKLPVFINNDANCFALGEKRYGVGKGCENLVGITLGTGLGCGLVFKGKLYNGANTGAGEVGCIPYLDKDFEHYCSTPFFTSEGPKTAQDFFSLAQTNHEEALNKWLEFGNHIGALCKSLLFMYDPDMIVFGGGIANAFNYFSPSISESLIDFPYKKIIEKLKIEVSNKPDISLLGAASLCYD
jgi:glucokinase